MKRHSTTNWMLMLSVGALLLMVVGCAAPKEDSKIPITTESETARENFLQGRDLFEKLRGQEARPFFERAIAEDPDFAMSYLFLSFVVPSAKGFWENLGKATELVDKVSQGERLWILGVEAGAHAYAMKQREMYKELVEAFPQDERAHNLLGNHYFGQEDYELAIREYHKATGINPDFSQPYNQLGYAHRFMENFDEAEDAFRKYIELIPDDPNPYDSYAELLMKTGRYDESIDQYKKALTADPNFVPSHVGIATNLNFKGNHQEAREQLQVLYDMARNDGERRAAHFATCVSYVDEGKTDAALEELGKQFALAENINDAAAMGGDLVAMGNILLEAGRIDEAAANYEKAVEVVGGSDLSEEVKDNTKRAFLFNAGRADLKKGDLDAAKTKAEEYRRRVEAVRNPFQVKLAHQLAGQIALEEKEYDRALEELQKSSLQNPYNWFRMALAFQGKGDKEKARDLCEKAAEWNALNSLNYSFMRHKASQMLESM
ncbi:MAG: tetratricopeptide repeat protein [Candidatus Zixiibacteriota bacterium]|nr:MAG: tetratricopeptide repeat protein [candidate division Zixibacteria bacterium]